MKHSTIALALCAVFASGAAQADPRAEVMAAFEKMMDDGSYHMRMSADTRNGVVSNEMQVQLPDRFHMKNEGGEFIVLPSGTWMNAGGQWMKMPMNMSQMIAGYSTEAMEKGMAAIQDVQYLGEESVEGCDSKHYSYNARGEFMGIKSDSQTEVWVCGDNGLPVRMVSSERGKDDKVTITYDWDKPVDIRAPN